MEIFGVGKLDQIGAYIKEPKGNGLELSIKIDCSSLHEERTVITLREDHFAYSVKNKLRTSLPAVEG